MIPADITPLETRQFQLLIRRSGASPAAFELRKFRSLNGKGYKVRVVGRGAATVGVPVRDRAGALAGTLCHFDVESHDVSDDEYLLLDRAARLMPAFLAQ